MTRIKIRRRHIQPQLSEQELTIVKLVRACNESTTAVEMLTGKLAQSQFQLGHAEGQLERARDHVKELEVRYRRSNSHLDHLMVMVKQENGPLYRAFQQWVLESDA